MRIRRIRQIATVAGLALVSVWPGRAHADFFCSAATKVAHVNGSPGTLGGSISADGFELYFAVENSGYGGLFDLYVATRTSTQEDWGPPANLGPTVNGATWEYTPNIAPDGLSLYFSSDRPGGSGGMDLWVATRTAKGDPWGVPVNLGPAVNSSVSDLSPRVSADALTLLFHSQRGGGMGGEDIWISTRPTKDEPWSTPRNLGQPVNSPYNDGEPTLSADGLILFFNSDRAGGCGSYDLWVTIRRTANDPWGAPVNLGPNVNSPTIEWCASLSADGSTLYFCSDRPSLWGPCSIYQTTISPIVEFNGDGRLDDDDVRILLAHWDTDEPMCDIGPTPFGDGVVDMQDLAVLTRYASQDSVDPTLVAGWAFDEVEGTVARDEAGLCDGILIGGPVWLPDGGAVGGAIQLDGIDDHVVAPFADNLCERPFSLFAWVKGGKPGQAIFTQRGGTDWLLAEASTGALATHLKSTGRTSRTLSSQAVITDGNWHRVALVWDGGTRTLYVDDALVAEDTQDNLKGAYQDLIIGSGANLAPGSFWSGLIDDVRLYNRVIKP